MEAQIRYPRTLRARLAAATAASILAAVVVFAVVTVIVVGNELRGSLDSALRQRAQEVAELAVTAPAVLHDPGAFETPDSGRQLAVEVINAHGTILARSLTLGAEVLPEDSIVQAALRHGRTGVANITLNGSPFRMYAAPIAEAGGPASGGAVLVASETTDISHTLSRLGVAVALSGAAVVLLASLGAALLTRRGLRPLRRLAAGAGEIERTADPSQRLPEAPASDEIGQLTGVLNRMLSSLQHAQASERRFLADASHELRTPVTALLGNVEYAVRHGADPEVLQDLRQDADRLARLVDELLVLERAGGEGAPAGEPVELDEVVRSVAGEHDHGRVRIQALQPVIVDGDPDALRRVVANLVENGLVHGPEAGTVMVGLTADVGSALLTVRDAGPGPDPAQSEHIFERFWRGPGAAGRPGSGLGLAIVAAIVERHRGTISVHGAQFTVRLPLAGHVRD